MHGYLNDCCKIELLASRIYQHFAAQGNFPERLRETFAQLARDEEDHARQFDLALELPEGALGDVKRIAWERIAAGLDRIRARFQDLHHEPCTAEQALKTALQLEKDFIRIHLDNSLYIEDQRIRRLFAGLARADEEHLATLREAIIWWNRRQELHSVPRSAG